jgi:CBS domain-containing protein
MGPPVPDPVGQKRGYTVANVMRPAVTTVETHGHLAVAAYLMHHVNESALVVVDEAGRPVAIITEADLLRAVAHGADTEQAHVTDWMNRNPLTIHPEAAVTEATRLMADTGNRHLPVVSDDGRGVGIVAISDIVDAVARSVRLASVVVFVSDLARSLAFYEPLLRYPITASDGDAALLTGPDGSQLYLLRVGDSSTRRNGGIGPQMVGWTAGGPDDLDRCTELLKERGAYVDRDTSEGFTFLEGRDPDGLPVIIAYPGPEQAPRHLIKSRVYQP